MSHEIFNLCILSALTYDSGTRALRSFSRKQIDHFDKNQSFIYLIFFFKYNVILITLSHPLFFSFSAAVNRYTVIM